MQSHDAMQAARLAVLEGALLALLRGAQEDGLDGMTVEVTTDAGQVGIDLTYSSNGVPVSGESL